MSKYLIRGRKLFSCHVWFEGVSTDIDCGDYIVYHGLTGNSPVKGEYKRNLQNSLVTDLTSDDEKIFSEFSSTVRNEINRSIKENVRYEMYLSDKILSDDTVLKNFSLMYKEMYKEKGLNRKLDTNELSAYAEKGDLMISAVFIDEKPVIYHSYIYSEKNARLLHSCSEFRNEDKAMKNSIGRANKYLHWKDMKSLKSIGIENYDWGGVSSFSEPNGIDKFKISFGGKPCTYYNVLCLRTFRAKVLFAIKKFLRK